LLRLIKFVKENFKNLNEWEVSKKATEIRSKGENYYADSFSSIVAFGSNAAMMHYSPQPDSSSAISDNNFLLIDSGGNYFDGTTDTTRTLVLGKITDEMKRNFTLVLKSNITLAQTVFVEGTCGIQLDAITRKPLWDYFIDYKCGTGHGIGYFGNVHEGPASISKRFIKEPLKEGMIFSNEPGVYGEYGIRTETTILVKRINEEFLGFETISFLPIDLNGVDKNYLTQKEIDWLNDYHKTTYEKLSPYLNDDEKEFLKYETREI
jgi:Xaa-Pro aminopeptidase